MKAFPNVLNKKHEMSELTVLSGSELKKRWETYRRENPKIRIRNAAAALGVSEAELVATSEGESVRRIDGDWGALLHEFESMGEVMALTRNDACVHEKTGVYRNVKIYEGHALVVDEQIDLRLFLDRWHFGFAVETPWEGAKDGIRRSLQFFDKHGTAVHKVFLTRKSNIEAYEHIVEHYRHASPSPILEIVPAQAKKSELSDDAIDADGFLTAWGDLQDTHDFFPLLRKYKVSRTQALRLAEGSFTERVTAASARMALQHAVALDTSIMVFVGNHGCIQIHTGPVIKLKEHGPWYNVLDPGFNLHLNEELIDKAWVVRKPTEDGIVTSLELFHSDGSVIAQFFGERKPGKPELEDWYKITKALPRR